MKKALKIINAGIFASLVLAVFPFSASAMSHTYTCADFLTSTGSCASDVFTFTGTGDSFSNSIAAFDLGSTATWFVTATVAPTSGTGKVGTRGDIFDYNSTFTTTLSDTPLSNVGNSSSQFVIFDDNSFVGTVANLCITDTPGECTPPASPQEMSSTTVIDWPGGDLAFAFMLYCAGLLFMIFLPMK